MKCVKNPIDGQILRLTEAEARKRVSYGWVYVTKGEWKRAIRPDLSAVRSAVSTVTSKLVAGAGQGFKRLG